MRRETISGVELLLFRSVRGLLNPSVPRLQEGVLLTGKEPTACQCELERVNP